VRRDGHASSRDPPPTWTLVETHKRMIPRMKPSPNAAYGNIQMLISVLRRNGGGMTLDALRGAIGGDLADIRATVDQAIADGFVSKLGSTVALRVGR
jgi:hypothetical protein